MRANTTILTFYGISIRDINPPLKLSLNSILMIETYKPNNLKFWGTCVKPSENSILFYQIN